VTHPLRTEYLIRHGPHVQQLLYCCVCIRCRGIMFIEPLRSNYRLFWLHYSGYQVLERAHRQLGDHISLLLFFQGGESRRKMRTDIVSRTCCAVMAWCSSRARLCPLPLLTYIGSRASVIPNASRHIFIFPSLVGLYPFTLNSHTKIIPNLKFHSLLIIVGLHIELHYELS
jgi:hypothetical protein